MCNSYNTICITNMGNVSTESFGSFFDFLSFLPVGDFSFDIYTYVRIICMRICAKCVMNSLESFESFFDFLSCLPLGDLSFDIHAYVCVICVTNTCNVCNEFVYVSVNISIHVCIYVCM